MGEHTVPSTHQRDFPEKSQPLTALRAWLPEERCGDDTGLNRSLDSRAQLQSEGASGEAMPWKCSQERVRVDRMGRREDMPLRWFPDIPRLLQAPCHPSSCIAHTEGRVPCSLSFLRGHKFQKGGICGLDLPSLSTMPGRRWTLRGLSIM